MRRYWQQARDNDSRRANTAISYIARLSQIETQLNDAFPQRSLAGLRDFAAVGRGRWEHSAPILQEFNNWLEVERDDRQILPKSPIRLAFTYMLNQWDARCHYTNEGYLRFDNNVAKRLVKYPAIGRKNYLFVGSPKAGHGAATLYSLVSSAKVNGVEPFAWLKAMFTRLPYFRNGEAFVHAARSERVTSAELDDLLPDRWLESHPNHAWTIDHVRRAERKAKQR